MTGTTESAVLDVLAPGGMLTAEQIKRRAHVTSWRARRAIRRLSSRGFILRSPFQSRWLITPHGNAAISPGLHR